MNRKSRSVSGDDWCGELKLTAPRSCTNDHDSLIGDGEHRCSRCGKVLDPSQPDIAKCRHGVFRPESDPVGFSSGCTICRSTRPEFASL